MNHIERNAYCQDSVALLFKWMYFSPQVLSIFRDKLLPPMLVVLERRVREVIRKLGDQAKREETIGLYRRSVTEKLTVEDNLTEYLRRVGPWVLSSEREEGEKSQENSFQELSSVKAKVPLPPQSKGKVTVPILNLSIATQAEAQPAVVSRSTRRNEMLNKSSVSTSNRAPQGEVSGVSREPSIRGDRRVSLGVPDSNLSYLDYGEAPQPPKAQPTESAREQLGVLARKMGEYFLSIDLGCLLENKRKSQLDEVAKLTGMKDEIKILESIMLDGRGKGISRIQNTDEKEQTSGTNAGLVTDRAREEILSDDSQDESLPPLLGTVSGQSGQSSFFSPNSSKPSPSSKSTQTKRLMKTYSRVMNTILNIIHLCMKNADYEQIQSLERLSLLLIQYLGTDLCAKNREKEFIFKLSQFSYWNSKRDDYLQKIDNVTDNHYEESRKPDLKGIFARDLASPTIVPSRKAEVTANDISTMDEATLGDTFYSDPRTDIKKLLLSEDEVIFKLIDTFSELNEKKTEFMRVNISEFFGETYIASLRRSQSQVQSKMDSPGREKTFSENIEGGFIPRIRGTPIINYLQPMQTFARVNTCPLLNRVSQQLEIILGYCPIGGEMFFPLINDQLSVLERYLTSTTSRVVLFEIVERVLFQLISLKAVFLRLNEVEWRDPQARSASHRNSPRRQQLREDRSLGRPSLGTLQ
jgi:hypothetical protein